MDQNWIQQSLGYLSQRMPRWLTDIKEFEPGSEFYSRLLTHESIPGTVEILFNNLGIRVFPTIEIVGDSEITTLDFNTGRRFDSKEINSAADVRSNSMASMKIRIGVRQISKPKNLAHILSHESAHHFMYISNIRAESDYENEMLTDLTAIYIGFGKLMLNSAQEDMDEFVKKPLYLSDNGIPYLGYPLLTYAYLLCQKERGSSRNQLLSNLGGPCIDYLKSFEFYYKRKNSFWNEIVRTFLGVNKPPNCNGRTICEEALKRDPNTHNIVSCIFCSASLRIPKSDKTLKLSCPKCRNSFTVKPRR